jgi:hypothetical protein
MYTLRSRSLYVPDIFDEVEEELRAERTREFLTRYAGAIAGAAILVVALVAAWQGWHWYQARQDRAAAAAYITSMLQVADTGPNANVRRDQALAGFDNLARSAPSGYRTLGRLRAAALEAEAGHLPRALALWNQIAADSSADSLLRGLASLLWAQHQLGTGDPDQLEARLRPLAAPGDPWRPLAEEQLALLALRQGKSAQANEMLTALAHDVTAPAGVRERATAVLSQLQG